MRLVDYQKSAGIPIEDNIVLVGNPLFYSKGYPCLDWRQKHSKLRREWNRLFGLSKSKGLLPDRSAVLFFGKEEKSSEPKGLAKLFAEIEKSRHEYVILCGKSDLELDLETYNKMPDNVLGLFINNLNIKAPRLYYMPMGRDFRARTLFKAFPPQQNKDRLVYCNFSLDTHPVRDEVFENVKKTNLADFDHMGRFLRYSLPHEEYFKRLAMSRFAICPRGNAIETFRMWDCLYLGTIPIVVKEAFFHEQLEDLPILFLDKVSDFKELSGDFLEKTYNEMLLKDYNFEKLTLNYWLSPLKNHELSLATEVTAHIKG